MSPRVLLVEDDPDIRRIASLALGVVGGFDVQTAAGGAEALKAISAVVPDLVLLDVMMPEMDGIATLAALRADERLNDVPIVFMTAKVQRGDIERYVQMGAAGVIRKPFDSMGLAAEVMAFVRSK
jgi:two-component system, OmpR family, response regulator